MENSGFTEYVTPTDFTNVGDSDIQAVARELWEQHPEESAYAVAAFYYVRDTIAYRLGMWNMRASETLAAHAGTCTNKANLLVALLRAKKIPAGFGVMKVVGPEYFGAITLSFFKPHIGKRSTHIHAYAYLHDRWIHVDPSDDEALSNATAHLNPQSTLIAWDGEHDAILRLNQADIIEHRGPLPSIDSYMEKKLRWYKRHALHIANRYLVFLRARGVTFTSVADIERAFITWLKEESFADYLVYLLVWGTGVLKEHARTLFIWSKSTHGSSS